MVFYPSYYLNLIFIILWSAGPRGGGIPAGSYFNLLVESSDWYGAFISTSVHSSYGAVMRDYAHSRWTPSIKRNAIWETIVVTIDLWLARLDQMILKKDGLTNFNLQKSPVKLWRGLKYVLFNWLVVQHKMAVIIVLCEILCTFCSLTKSTNAKSDVSIDLMLLKLLC